MKGHPKWSLKTGSLTGNIKTRPEERSEAPRERQMVSRGARMETSPAWGALRYECPGGELSQLYRDVLIRIVEFDLKWVHTARYELILRQGVSHIAQDHFKKKILT